MVKIKKSWGQPAKNHGVSQLGLLIVGLRRLGNCFYIALPPASLQSSAPTFDSSKLFSPVHKKA